MFIKNFKKYILYQNKYNLNLEKMSMPEKKAIHDTVFDKKF